ncbi:MAG: hypothetical protein ABIS01_18165 [Ferruginibacter sp.]
MENSSTHQEVLLITGTKFVSRQYIEKDTSGNSKNFTGNEHLKDACWNGLLKEMLPEIFACDSEDIKMCLWQVREANQFFALEMSEFPVTVDKYLSIDPYRFMEVHKYN